MFDGGYIFSDLNGGGMGGLLVNNEQTLKGGGRNAEDDGETTIVPLGLVFMSPSSEKSSRKKHKNDKPYSGLNTKQMKKMFDKINEKTA